MTDTQKLLADLVRAKALFQQRALMAVLEARPLIEAAQSTPFRADAG